MGKQQASIRRTLRGGRGQQWLMRSSSVFLPSSKGRMLGDIETMFLQSASILPFILELFLVLLNAQTFAAGENLAAKWGGIGSFEPRGTRLCPRAKRWVA